MHDEMQLPTVSSASRRVTFTRANVSRRSLSTKSEPASQSSHSQLSLGRIFKVTFRYISTVDELPPRLLDLRYSCK
ncbi:hypothetical protein CYMTET_54696 [Cymbomonas tetramitiformis]|uniref:Uncharacterized protein n=1 Tax=Cymbomonas tetramitiformis TaxID=36881 RepID=A0AAE0BFL4_9CHLO|nr:hypothetical protein CYMTET_54696 [Cymbomonas tetramitiformis]